MGWVISWAMEAVKVPHRCEAVGVCELDLHLSVRTFRFLAICQVEHEANSLVLRSLNTARICAIFIGGQINRC